MTFDELSPDEQRRLIDEQVVGYIRAKYSLEDELKFLRIELFAKVPDPEASAYNAYVEECRAWGRGEKYRYGLI